jgi:hypothetical protein
MYRRNCARHVGDVRDRARPGFGVSSRRRELLGPSTTLDRLRLGDPHRSLTSLALSGPKLAQNDFATTSIGFQEAAAT